MLVLSTHVLLSSLDLELHPLHLEQLRRRRKQKRDGRLKRTMMECEKKDMEKEKHRQQQQKGPLEIKLKIFSQQDVLMRIYERFQALDFQPIFARH